MKKKFFSPFLQIEINFHIFETSMFSVFDYHMKKESFFSSLKSTFFDTKLIPIPVLD